MKLYHFRKLVQDVQLTEEREKSEKSVKIADFNYRHSPVKQDIQTAKIEILKEEPKCIQDQ